MGLYNPKRCPRCKSTQHFQPESDLCIAALILQRDSALASAGDLAERELDLEHKLDIAIRALVKGAGERCTSCRSDNVYMNSAGATWCGKCGLRKNEHGDQVPS